MTRPIAVTLIALTPIAAAVAALWVVTVGPADSPGVRVGRFSLEQLLVNVAVTLMALPAAYVVLGRSRWRRRAKRVALGTLLLLLVWFLVELPAGLGIVDYGTAVFQRKIGGDGPNPMQLDAELLFRHAPDDRFVVEQPWDATVAVELPPGRPYRVEYVYDRNGFRNPRDYRQATVVLVGDSFVEGYLVPHELVCAARLERILRVDVCNLGQNDYGPAQELVVLKRYAVDLGPRVIVWLFFEENDLFDLEDYELATRGWRGHFVRPGSVASRSFCLNALHRLGRAVEPFGRGLDAPGQEQAVELMPEIPGGPVTMHFGPASGGPSPKRRERLLAKTGQILREADAVCRQNGIKLLVVYAPESYRVYRDLCVVPQGSPLARRRLSDLPQRIWQICAAAGIAYLDLTAALKTAARDGSLVYIPGDVHWSRQGHAVAAEELAALIRKAGWLQRQ